MERINKQDNLLPTELLLLASPLLPLLCTLAISVLI